MNANELRGKSVDELNKELMAQREAQFKMRMKHRTGQMEQTHELKICRRAIARIKTILTEKAGS
jgi:large subunit ribosomal protein L29